MKRIAAVCATVVLMAGCAAPSAQYENQAVAHAFETEAELRAWVQACRPVSGAASAAASNADRTWWERNGAMMAAADYGFVRELDGFSDDRREDTVALFAMQAGYSLKQQMEARVTAELDTRNPERVCVRELADFEAGDRDLSQDPQHYGALVALSNEAGMDQQAIRASRQPARPENDYGRSFYEVESALAAEQCADPSVSLLRADWPRETYEAQCADQRYQLVSCEWNRCTVY